MLGRQRRDLSDKPIADLDPVSTKDLRVVSRYTELMSRWPTGFAGFYRRYTKTWVHALATAALTAFGTLTFVDARFAALAIVAYVLPPVVLYLTRADLASGERVASPEQAASSDVDGRSPDDEEDHWTAPTVPTTRPLRDAAVTDEATYAVGDGGLVLVDDGSGWSVALADGPGASGNDLSGASATAAAVWVAGDGGALGRIDAGTGRHVDYSAPGDDTTNIVAIASADTDDTETVLVADGGGRVRRGVYRDGDLAWDAPVTPASGSSVAGVTLGGDGVGYVCDTAATLVKTTDGGRTFAEVGFDGVEGTLTDVAATATPAVSSDDGVAARYDSGTWTPERLSDAALTGLVASGNRWLACAADGAVFEWTDGSAWERTATPASGPLYGTGLGAHRAVAVGDGGTVVERRL